MQKQGYRNLEKAAKQKQRHKHNDEETKLKIWLSELDHRPSRDLFAPLAVGQNKEKGVEGGEEITEEVEENQMLHQL
ncbi:hypothetical protein EYF80_011106 [Liparis tanakae]|uniref:Uncharacterized protein n=1 Tax=Liparis tanakae TaxID=230148 RepID=A0A4Z2INA4_9TELE|nr:hypothetical protein EYF80_011106 [Liparis tanakae]